MNVSKRSLAESYVAATGVVLGALLLSDVILALPDRVRLWTLTGLLPVGLLVSAHYWLPRVPLDDDQVWTVAECGALGLGVVTLVVAALALGTRSMTGVSTLTAALAANVTTGAVAGVLVGVAWEQHRTIQRETTRNEVLARILRHNLRNDMTVVQGHLDHLATQLEPGQREQIATVQRKIDTLVELTEKFRRVDTVLKRGGKARHAVEVVDLVETEAATAARGHDGRIETDLPDEARAYADDLLGTVLADLFESVVARDDAAPVLRVTVTRSLDWVDLHVEDVCDGLPANDLSVVEAGAETELHHGSGIDLWLLDWLVDAYGGEVTVETGGDHSSIEVRLQRVRRPDAGREP